VINNLSKANRFIFALFTGGSQDNCLHERSYKASSALVECIITGCSVPNSLLTGSLLIPRLFNPDLNLVKPVENKAMESIDQSGSSWITTRSCPPDRYANPIFLSGILELGELPAGTSHSLIPDRTIDLRNLDEKIVLEVSNTLEESLDVVVNLVFEEFRILILHLLKPPSD